MQRCHLVNHLDHLLAAERIKDYCTNGLQIEGRDEVNRIVTAVTASASAVEKAIEENADVLLVHHGYFWKGEQQPIIGMKKKRIAALLAHDINLIAYHLPLDVHTSYGNNAGLAEHLGFKDCHQVSAGGTEGLLWYGSVGAGPVEGDVFAMRLAHVLQREPLHVSVERPIRQVAWCSGGAQDFIEQAVGLGVDAFISGEISERTYYQAKELGIHYFAAGHHATERYGVQALGNYLAAEFGFDHTFYDEPNPV